MIRPELLSVLICPEDRSALTVVDAGLLSRLNAAIQAGTLKNKAGALLDQKLDTALIREDQTVVYAVVDDIPRMLIDEGILLDQPGLSAS